VGVVYDYLCFDHLPLFGCFRSLVHLTVSVSNGGLASAEKFSRLCDWPKTSVNNITS